MIGEFNLDRAQAMIVSKLRDEMHRVVDWVRIGNPQAGWCPLGAVDELIERRWRKASRKMSMKTRQWSIPGVENRGTLSPIPQRWAIVVWDDTVVDERSGRRTLIRTLVANRLSSIRGLRERYTVSSNDFWWTVAGQDDAVVDEMVERRGRSTWYGYRRATDRRLVDSRPLTEVARRRVNAFDLDSLPAIHSTAHLSSRLLHFNVWYCTWLPFYPI